MKNIIPALLPFILLLVSSSGSISAELSSAELREAETRLRGFELSGRGIPEQKPFIFSEEEFPRECLKKELMKLRALFKESGVRLNVMMVNALKRPTLDDAELVVAVRNGRRIEPRAISFLRKLADRATNHSEQDGTGQPPASPESK